MRQTRHDYSQALRHGFQLGFLLLNLYLGEVFYLWVRQFETGRPSSVARPAGVEGWLPIAAMMNLKYWLMTGQVPAVHPAGMFLLLAFLAMAFLLRKTFCSWLCPIGTISEYFWRTGRKLFRRTFQLPRLVDLPLRGLKYLLLGFFIWAVATMSPASIAAFLSSPYGTIADVKMLNFFRHMGTIGFIVLSLLAGASLFLQNFWCRYACPYGALLGLAALFSPASIRRNASACIDCGICSKACPSLLPVQQLVTVQSAECTGCMECVAVCPAKDALQMSLPRVPRMCAVRIPAWAIAAAIAVLFLGIVGYAKAAAHWNTPVPRALYMELVPHADEAKHPMPGD